MPATECRDRRAEPGTPLPVCQLSGADAVYLAERAAAVAQLWRRRRIAGRLVLRTFAESPVPR